LGVDNVTAVRAAGLTLFEPGSLQSVVFLERRGLGVWSFYDIIRAGDGSSALAASHEGSYVNRLVALYRYMAGVPTDLEPPAVRRWSRWATSDLPMSTCRMASSSTGASSDALPPPCTAIRRRSSATTTPSVRSFCPAFAMSGRASRRILPAASFPFVSTDAW